MPAAIINVTADHIRSALVGAEPGHDWWHVHRVWRRARHIQQREGGDRELIELAALLHDLHDYKFEGGDLSAGPEAARRWLNGQGYPEDRASAVATIIAAVHYKGPAGEERAESLEHAVVQDADRLDAIGAIGVARAFSYGGYFNRAMLDPELLPDLRLSEEAYRKGESPTINHFFEKILLLKDRMLTKTGAELAEEAHAFTVEYLKRFFAESFVDEDPPQGWLKLF